MQSNTTPTELDAALEYARKGIPVFPCNPLDKKPLTSHGFKDATTDEAQIQAWWGRWPNAMVAAPTGAGAWRLTADLLFSVEHSEIREAFFPSHEAVISIDAALPGDRGAVFAIAERHEPPEIVRAFEHWWDHGRAFFDVAVAQGAEVLHQPRVWPEYHPNYYGAFVRDPDGNNVEAVCHTAE